MSHPLVYFLRGDSRDIELRVHVYTSPVFLGSAETGIACACATLAESFAASRTAAVVVVAWLPLP